MTEKSGFTSHSFDMLFNICIFFLPLDVTTFFVVISTVTMSQFENS